MIEKEEKVITNCLRKLYVQKGISVFSNNSCIGVLMNANGIKFIEGSSREQVLIKAAIEITFAWNFCLGIFNGINDMSPTIIIPNADRYRVSEIIQGLKGIADNL